MFQYTGLMHIFLVRQSIGQSQSAYQPKNVNEAYACNMVAKA